MAKEYPEEKFAIIDADTKGENIAAVVYREQEGDFLMGVLAAMISKSQKIGMIGGVDMEITRRIESGFRQGVTYQDQTKEVLIDLAGTFSDPVVGKTLALAQYAQGSTLYIMLQVEQDWVLLRRQKKRIN